MGCFITIIGVLVGILGLFLFGLAHSFGAKGEMIWGIVLMVLGATLFLGGLTFDIFFKKENVNRAITFGVFAAGLILGLLGWRRVAYSPMIGNIIFLCFLCGSIVLMILWSLRKRKGE